MASNMNLSGSITMTNGASAVLKQVEADMARTNAMAQKHTAAATSAGAGWAKAAVGIGIAAVGIGSLTRIIGDSISAAAEDEKSVTSLGIAMRNLGKAKEQAGLESWVSDLQLAQGKADDLIRNGLVRLVSATKDVTTAKSAMKVALDIEAAGFADSTSAAKALSAGYMGNFTALQRLKLPISAAALASKDMTKITRELTGLVGGQAAAAADTYAGKMARLEQAVNEAKETIGYGLLKAFDSLSGGGDNGLSGAQAGLQGFADSLVEVIEKSVDGAKGVDSLVGAITDLVATDDGASAANDFFADSLAGIGEAAKAIAGGPLYSIGGAIGVVSEKAEEGKTYHDRYKYSLQEAAAAARDAAEGNTDLAPEIDKVALAVLAAAPPVNALADALGLFDTRLDQARALKEYQSALAEYVKKPSAETAASVIDNFQSTYDSLKDGGVKQAKFVKANYAEMKAAIKSSGLGAAAKAELVDALRDATNQADQLLKSLNLLDGKRVAVSVVMSQLGAAAPYVTGRAGGGPVFGPGSGTSDSIPIRVSNGEYIVKASAAKAVGYDTLDWINAQGYATGGKVSKAAAAIANAAGRATQLVATQSRPYESPELAALLDAAEALDQSIRDDQAEDARKAAEAAQDKARKAAEDAAAQAQRDAEELHRQQQAIIGAARQLLQEATATRNDFAKAVATGGINYGSILGYSAESSDWASLSMRAPGSEGAGGPGSTGGSISAYMQGRLTRVKSFGQVIKDLNLAGLNSSTLRKVIAAGPDEGYTLGKALLDAGVGEINSVNSIQTSLEDVSAGIGAYSGNTIYGGGVMDAYGNYTNTVAANGGSDANGQPIQLVLDGQVVLNWLLQTKRTRGNVPLGIA